MCPSYSLLAPKRSLSTRLRREYPSNAIVVPEYTDRHVLASDAGLEHVRAYLEALLRSDADDVREFVASTPFDVLGQFRNLVRDAHQVAENH